MAHRPDTAEEIPSDSPLEEIKAWKPSRSPSPPTAGQSPVVERFMAAQANSNQTHGVHPVFIPTSGHGTTKA